MKRGGINGIFKISMDAIRAKPAKFQFLCSSASLFLADGCPKLRHKKCYYHVIKVDQYYVKAFEARLEEVKF